jgi:hypothetical protein
MLCKRVVQNEKEANKAEESGPKRPGSIKFHGTVLGSFHGYDGHPSPRYRNDPNGNIPSGPERSTTRLPALRHAQGNHLSNPNAVTSGIVPRTNQQ